MIRLMLASYSKDERFVLAEMLERSQNTIEAQIGCKPYRINCSDCRMRHLCTDLLSAAVFAKDYKPDTK